MEIFRFFFFENCTTSCPICHVVFHESGRCLVGASNKTAGRQEDSSIPVLGFAANALFHSSFKFQGSSSPVAAPASRFDQGSSSKLRRPVIIKQHSRLPEADSLALVPVQEVEGVVLDVTDAAAVEVNDDLGIFLADLKQKKFGNKRERPASPETSPKKPKLVLDHAVKMAQELAGAKRLKQPAFLAGLSAKSLGLVATVDGDEVAVEKKKRGKPLGHKKKKVPKLASTPSEAPSAVPGAAPSCPSLKGKEIA